MLGGRLEHAIREELFEADGVDLVYIPADVIARERVSSHAQISAPPSQVDLASSHHLLKRQMVVLSVLLELHLRLVGFKYVTR